MGLFAKPAHHPSTTRTSSTAQTRTAERSKTLMRNTVAFGASCALLDIPTDHLNDIIRDTFGHKGEAVVKLNVDIIAAGYQPIGLDHFARPHDPLAQQLRKGKLHRNFQGYSTKPDCDLLAFGISAIGKVGAAYVQNVKTPTLLVQSEEDHRTPIGDAEL